MKWWPAEKWILCKLGGNINTSHAYRYKFGRFRRKINFQFSISLLYSFQLFWRFIWFEIGGRVQLLHKHFTFDRVWAISKIAPKCPWRRATILWLQSNLFFSVGCCAFVFNDPNWFYRIQRLTQIVLRLCVVSASHKIDSHKLSHKFLNLYTRRRSKVVVCGQEGIYEWTH